MRRRASVGSARLEARSLRPPQPRQPWWSKRGTPGGALEPAGAAALLADLGPAGVDALAAAIRYSTSALNVAKARATELASDENASLVQMREYNAGFVTVTAPKLIGRETVISPVAHTVRAVMTEKQITKKQQQRRADDERIAREALEL